jgi:membrane protein YdbS with pleckstrin-like domain
MAVAAVTKVTICGRAIGPRILPKKHIYGILESAADGPCGIIDIASCAIAALMARMTQLPRIRPDGCKSSELASLPAMMEGMAGNDGLTPDERLVLRLHPHAKTMLRPAVILLLILAVAIAIIVIVPLGAASAWPIRAAIGVAALVAGVIWFGVPLLRWRTTTYEITTRRLRMRQGILSRSGRDFPLNRISDVSFKQGIIDRLLGAGQLIVESPGEQGRLVLSEIPEVQRVQSVLFELVEKETSPTRFDPGS